MTARILAVLLRVVKRSTLVTMRSVRPWGRAYVALFGSGGSFPHACAPQIFFSARLYSFPESLHNDGEARAGADPIGVIKVERASSLGIPKEHLPRDKNRARQNTRRGKVSCF